MQHSDSSVGTRAAGGGHRRGVNRGERVQRLQPRDSLVEGTAAGRRRYNGSERSSTASDRSSDSESETRSPYRTRVLTPTSRTGSVPSYDRRRAGWELSNHGKSPRLRSPRHRSPRRKPLHFDAAQLLGLWDATGQLYSDGKSNGDDLPTFERFVLVCTSVTTLNLNCAKLRLCCRPCSCRNELL